MAAGSVPSKHDGTNGGPGQVLFAVGFYIVTSITMVLANKWVLKALPDLPLVFLWLQLVVAVVLLTISHLAGVIELPTYNHSGVLLGGGSGANNNNGTRASGLPAVNWTKSRRLGSLIAINVVGLAGNTLCLKYMDASLYQVARSLVLPFTVLLQYSMLRQPSSFAIICACGVVTLGFVVGLFLDEEDPSAHAAKRSAHGNGVNVLGIFFGVFSSVTTAIHAIIIKKSLDVVGGRTMELAWYNNVLSMLAMIPIVLCTGELSRLSAALQSSAAFWTFLNGTLLTGVFGFLINLAGFFQIKVTSPVTHMISSAVRGVLQTFLAVWLFREVLTSSRAIGIALILSGSTWYTFEKSKSVARVELKPSTPDCGSALRQDGSEHLDAEMLDIVETRRDLEANALLNSGTPREIKI